jgi:2-C-methyl-D-erythritol 4-phosphate cytidylyltransferase
MLELDKQQEAEKKILIYREAKARVQGVYNALKKVAKKLKTKATKKQKKAFALMEDFLRCNITSPAIEYKYERIVALLSTYGNKEEENANQE